MALELEAKGVRPRQVICVADADWAHIVGGSETGSLLLFTDFTSMEIYAFREDIIGKVLLNVSPMTKASARQILAELAEPLQFLFAMRITNLRMGLGLKWIEKLEKFCRHHGGAFGFNGAEFERRFLRIRVSNEKVNEFDTQREALGKLFRTDERYQIRGHDFVKLLTWILRKQHGCSHLNEESVRQMLYTTLPSSELVKLPLFIELLNRTAK